MRNLVLLFMMLFSLNTIAATIPISQLPLGSAAGTSINDSFPYVMSTTNTTKRLLLSDLINIPALATPTFTGTVTAPLFSGPLNGNASGLSTKLAIASGGTNVTSVTTAPTASSFAGWDANSNLSANNHIPGYTTTVTAAGTTTLVMGSTYNQYFTGSTTQTVVLPVVSTLTAGLAFNIVNNSTGALTVNSSGGNLVATVPAGTALAGQSVVVTCVLTSGTTAASWSVVAGGGGTVTLGGDVTGPSGSNSMKSSVNLPGAPTLTPSSGNFAALALGLVSAATTTQGQIAIVSGHVGITGTVVSGSGWSVSLAGALFTITFTKAFSGVPHVTASLYTGGTPIAVLINIYSATASAVGIATITTGGGASAQAFQFIAVGPK